MTKRVLEREIFLAEAPPGKASRGYAGELASFSSAQAPAAGSGSSLASGGITGAVSGAGEGKTPKS